MELLVTAVAFGFWGLGEEGGTLAAWKRQIKFAGCSVSHGSKRLWLTSISKIVCFVLVLPLRKLLSRGRARRLGFMKKYAILCIFAAPQTDRPLSPRQGSPAPRRVGAGARQAAQEKRAPPSPPSAPARARSRSHEPTRSRQTPPARGGDRDPRRPGRPGGAEREAGSPGRGPAAGRAGAEWGERRGLALLWPSGDRCSRRSR